MEFFTQQTFLLKLTDSFRRMNCCVYVHIRGFIFFISSHLVIFILTFSSCPHRLMIGFMIVSSFLSMWISNTATTAMMLPIAHAVLQQLKTTEAEADQRDFQSEDNQAFELETKQTKCEIITEKPPLEDTKAPVEDRVCELNYQLH